MKTLVCLALLTMSSAFAEESSPMPVDRITVEGTKAHALIGILKRSQVQYRQGFEGGYFTAGTTQCIEQEGLTACTFGRGEKASAKDSAWLVDILKKLDVAIYGQDEDGTTQWRLHDLDCAGEWIETRAVEHCTFSFDAF